MSDRLLKPLLVGEDNPYSKNPMMALWPEPPNAAGGRLLRILGISRYEYLHAFERTNLELVSDRVGFIKLERRAIFLLGAKVSRAFQVPYGAWSSVGNLHVLPHPSGLCRTWNEPAAVPMTREFVADALRRAGYALNEEDVPTWTRVEPTFAGFRLLREEQD